MMLHLFRLFGGSLSSRRLRSSPFLDCDLLRLSLFSVLTLLSYFLLTLRSRFSQFSELWLGIRARKRSDIDWKSALKFLNASFRVKFVLEVGEISS